VAWRYEPRICWAFTGSRDGPEQAGWALAIEFIQNSENYRYFNRIGIVVDAHLGTLDQYNGRTLPIVPEVYLPSRMSLLYAAYDTGGEYLSNQLLRCSDHAATFCLKQIRDGTVRLPQKRVDPFEALLVIDLVRYHSAS
jgi:hypothetical protein